MNRNILSLSFCLLLLSCTTSKKDSDVLDKGEWKDAEQQEVVNDQEESSDFSIAQFDEKRTKNYKSFDQALLGNSQNEVEREAKKIMLNNPNDRVVLNGLSYFYRKIKKYRMSELLARKVLALDESNLKGRYNLAMVFLARGKWNEALQELSGIEKINPNAEKVKRGIASIYLANGLSKKAGPYLEKLWLAQKNDINLAASFLETQVAEGNIEKSREVVYFTLKKKDVISLASDKDGSRILISYLDMLSQMDDIKTIDKEKLEQISVVGDQKISIKAKNILSKAADKKDKIVEEGT